MASILTAKQLRALRAQSLGVYTNRVAAAIRITETVQAEMARETGFSQQYISDVANARYQDILVQRAHVFAEFFGCLIEDIFPYLGDRK